MSATIEATATQIYRVFIKASPERIWEAITTPEFTAQYFHTARITASAHGYRSLGPDGSVWGDETVFEWDPPRRLVHSWSSMYDPGMAAEPRSRVTWEIDSGDAGVCMLTVTHDQLEDSPKTRESVAGRGWMFVLSGLKTLLETGEPLS